MKRISAFVMIAALSLPAWGQSGVPAAVNPLQTLPEAKTLVPKKEVEAKIETSRRNQALKALLSKTIHVRHIRISGVAAVDFDRIANLFAPLAGRSVKLEQLIKASARCRDVYAQAGYALAFCYIPNQNLNSGRIQVVAVEGYVKQIDLKGEGAGGMRRKIMQIVQPLLHQRPLRKATFERVAQLLRTLPGTRFDISVPAPKTTSGATTMVLDIKRQLFDFGYGLQFNQPGVAGILTASTHGLTPLGGSLTAGGMVPDGDKDQNFYTLRYSQMLGGDGLQLTVSGSHYTGSPEDDTVLLRNVHLQQLQKQDRVALTLSYPLALDNHQKLTVTGSVYGTDAENKYRFFNTVTDHDIRLNLETRTRAIQLALNYLRVANGHTSRVGFGVTQGIDGLGAGHEQAGTYPATVSAPEIDFTSYNFSFSQADTWWAGIGTEIAARIQYSTDPLPSSELITFGGSAFGHAYDPGTFSGASGWGVAAEMNRPIHVNEWWLQTVMPYARFESLRTYADTEPAFPGPSAYPHSFESAVLGLRFSDNRHYFLDFFAAKPTEDHDLVAVNDDWRWGLSFSYQFGSY